MAGGCSNSEVIHGTQQTLLQCTPEAYATLQRLQEVCPAAEVSMSMNSYLTERDNTVCGWFVKLPPTTPAGVIPFASNMFEGVTVVETMASEDEILDLLKHRKTTLQKVSDIAQRFVVTKNPNRASWYRCRPQRALPLQKTNTWHVVMHQENMARYTTVGPGGNTVKMAHNAPLDLVPDDTVPNYIDSADWVPELSVGGSIGLYHQWYTNMNGRRELKLYIVCHSVCHMAGLEIKQIVNDIPRGTTAYDLATSEEVWWLENINTRNRNRLIAQLAGELGVAVPLVDDCHAARPTKMASPLTQTLIHGIYNYRDGAVGVAHECMPTTFVSNGVVCKMSPWDGYFIFKGPHATPATRFGTAFGTGLDTFPVTATRLSAHTEPIARKLRYIVQSSSPVEGGFWADPSYVAPPPAQSRGPPESAALTAGSGASDDEGTAEADGGFVWAGDPALEKVAMQIWRKTKRNELSKQNAQQAGGTSAAPRACSGELSYISFDDHVVLSRLANVHWDQRYGILRLVPLCLFSNGLFR